MTATMTVEPNQFETEKTESHSCRALEAELQQTASIVRFLAVQPLAEISRLAQHRRKFPCLNEPIELDCYGSFSHNRISYNRY